jgi:hypothetical protein
VTNVYDPSQEDLEERDLFIIDSSDIIFVWKGHKVEPLKEKRVYETAVEYCEITKRPGIEILLVHSRMEPPEFTR